MVVDLVPTNAPRYKLPFIIAQIDVDVSSMNTTDPTCCFQVQVLCPCDLISVTKKFIRWQGDDNNLWRPIIQRSTVKAIVHLTPRTKSLRKSL